MGSSNDNGTQQVNTSLDNRDFDLDDLAALTKWDTPTICNGLELVCPERRAIGFTTRPLVSLDDKLPSVCGIACTARIRSHAPSPASAAESSSLRLAYYEYVWNTQNPSIIVIEDLDDTPGVGAFWGEVHTAVHKALGCAAGVTNGSMRDLDDVAPGFQLLAGNVGPSHAHVHLVDFGKEVTVHNMSVDSGDVIHADCHGAVVVPDHAVKALPAAIDLLSRREEKILTAVRSTDFTFEKLKAAIGAAGEIH